MTDLIRSNLFLQLNDPNSSFDASLPENHPLSNLVMSPVMRKFILLLVRIDQSLTGHDDRRVWNTLGGQLSKMEDILFASEHYYLSDGGMSRLVVNVLYPANSFVTTNSTPRVQWLWAHDESMVFQLQTALTAVKKLMESNESF